MGSMRRYTTAAELKTRLERFEQEFNMPSEEFIQALKRGQLGETEEFREWLLIYEAWRVAAEKT